jgi:hypothetical protein
MDGPDPVNPPGCQDGDVDREQPTDPPGRPAVPESPEPDQPPAGMPAAEHRPGEDRGVAGADQRAAAVAAAADEDGPPPDPDVPAPAQSGQDQPVAGRSERSPKDMAMSLLVLLVPILLLLALYRIVLGGDEPVPVDPAPAVAQARASNAFPVSEPANLHGGWRPVSAAFQSADAGRTLRIGYVSPEGRGIQLVQSNVPPEQLLPAELTSNGQAQGVTEVAGRDWQRYSARPGERALVLLEERRTVVIVGDAAEGELRSLAGALR